MIAIHLSRMGQDRTLGELTYGGAQACVLRRQFEVQLRRYLE